MSIYAIGDLHLSFIENKPMNIFGDNWENHEQKIKKNWESKVKNEDLVILPGDFSWAMNLKNTKKDFEYINNLPGIKILTKGNHDYWWTTIKSMRDFIKENNFNNIDFIINNAILFENNLIVGTRGWSFTETENSEKMLNRELSRLENSVKFGLKLIENNKQELSNNILNTKIICVMHYPPITKQMIQNNIKSPYIELMKKYNIHKCIYGHLHGKSHSEAVTGNIDGVELKLVSSDFIDFNPVLII